MNDVKLNVSQSKGYEGADLIKVENKDGVAVVGSRVVAKDFGKRHADVIRAIEEYLTDAEVRSLNCLIESSYIDSKGEDRKEYLMTRDGFSLLVMGFKGKEALQWKLKYIDAFNKMEHVIQERSQKANLLLMIYEGGPDGVSASKRLVEIETRELNQQIQVMTPKAESYDQFINADGTYTTTNACKMLGLNRAEVFRVLREKGMVYKKKTEATQKAVDKGYFKHVIKGGHSTMAITAKGVEYLRELFLDEAC